MPPSAPQRGELIDNPPKKMATYAPSDLLALLAGSDLGKIFLQLAYTPKCTITVYHLTYETADPKGNITPASGAFMVPSSGSDSACTGGRPIVLYAHGTTTDRTFDLAAVGTASVIVASSWPQHAPSVQRQRFARRHVPQCCGTPLPFAPAAP